MNKKLFTKSAFKQALTCPASLYYYYHDKEYANQMSEDDFLQALADGGNQVGDLAKLYYGVQPYADLEGCHGYAQSLKETAKLFANTNVVIAEAAFCWGNCFVRADIIVKEGRHIKLVEVKAKSWNPKTDAFRKKKDANAIETAILPYVYDVAFQKYVIQNALKEKYPGEQFTVEAFLYMADKSVVSNAPNGVNQFFEVVKNANGKGSHIIRKPGATALLGCNKILCEAPVDVECNDIITGNTTEQMAVMGMKFKEFVDVMSSRYVGYDRGAQVYAPVGAKCFNCPFHSTDAKQDGRDECWMHEKGFALSTSSKPLVGELWCGQLGNIPLKKNLLERDGKVFLEDISEADIPDSKTPNPGLLSSERRKLQIALTTGNADMLKPFGPNIHDGIYLDIEGLKAEMKDWHYPLHMIDFETTAVALPFYENLRPYEQVAFQFSHHKIDRIEKDGKVEYTIEHVGQYINTKKNFFPNFEFLRELKSQLEKDQGTIFRYATHENTILRVIREQLEASKERDKDELKAFIDSITQVKSGNATTCGPRNMVDLLEVVKRYYYHPSMKGSNSIKVVLPAVLNSSAAIQKKYSEPIYGDSIPSKNYTPATAICWINKGSDSKIENPYKALSNLRKIASFLGVTPEELEVFDSARDMDESIANGGAALAAYTMLQFSSAKMTKTLEQALLRYCELDTMSMVFIWEYFHEKTGI